jgi:hypothetical protein
MFELNGIWASEAVSELVLCIMSLLMLQRQQENDGCPGACGFQSLNGKGFFQSKSAKNVGMVTFLALFVFLFNPLIPIPTLPGAFLSQFPLFYNFFPEFLIQVIQRLLEFAGFFSLLVP